MGTTVEETPVVRQVNQLLADAVKSGASDIHLMAVGDDRAVVRFRVNRVLQEHGTLEGDAWRAALSRLKILAGLNVSERRLPQDGQFGLRVAGGDYTFIVSVLPTSHGEDVCLRLLDHGAKPLKVADIFPDEAQRRTVLELLQKPHGLIVCSGPTGSGKGMLAYALLAEVAKPDARVFSVEEHIAPFDLENVTRVTLAPTLGVIYPSALRAVLRHDPDLLLIGEQDDPETAQLTAEAALTGHLVLTVLHANTAADTVQRLKDLTLTPYQINAVLQGVIAQRLVRKLCPKCRKALKKPDVKAHPEAARFLRRQDGDFYTHVGCEECNGTGYRRRVGIHSFLLPDDRFREAVSAKTDLRGLERAARASGTKTLFEAALDLAARGVTSLEEACAVTWDTRPR